MELNLLRQMVALCVISALVAGCAAQKELASDAASDGSVVIEVEDELAQASEIGSSTSLTQVKAKRKIRLSKEEQEEFARRGDSPNFALSNKARAGYCPKLEILNGTGVLTAYIDGGNDEPGDVTHQASITRSGRECKNVDGTLNIRVGAAGRAVQGPKSLSSNISLPIRVAVVRGGTEVLFSQIYSQQINFASANAQGFSFVEENLQIPFPEEENLKILVGFDVKNDPTLASNNASNDDG